MSESARSKEYALAVPTFKPVPAFVSDGLCLLLNNSRMWLLFKLRPIAGVPETLFSLSLFPIVKGTEDVATVLVVLGFATSRIVVDVFSISYPRTYAFPGETLIAKRSSVGVFPFSVIWPGKKTPSDPKRSLREFSTSILKGSTA